MPPPGPLTDAVARLLDGGRRPAVVVTDLDVEVDAPDTTWVRVGEPLPEGPRLVVLVTADAESLRRDVSRAGNLRWARTVGCVLADSPAALTLRPHPSWPALADLDTRVEARVEAGVEGRAGGRIAVTRLDFDARLEVAPVLMALAAHAAAPVVPGPGGLRVAGDVVPPADPTWTAAYDVDDERPADVVVRDGASGGRALDISPVTGRAPLLLSAEQAGVPLDEAVHNPIGFRRTWDRPAIDLPGDTRLSAALVASLRDAQAVRVAPDADPRLVAALAMCGVPTEAYDDPVERERHSVRTRRAALLAHSTTAWRARLAERAGLRHEQRPGGPQGDLQLSTDDPDEVTDLLLARRYSGADVVVLPDDPERRGVTECYVTTPPAGAVLSPAGRSVEDVVAAGGTVYVGRPRGAG